MNVDYSLTIDETVGTVASDVLVSSGARYCFIADLSIANKIRVISERSTKPLDPNLFNTDRDKFFNAPSIFVKFHSSVSARKSRNFFLDEECSEELSRITRSQIARGESVIVVPSLTRNFVIAAVGATSWKGRPLNEMTYLLETTSLRFLGTSKQSQISLERLTPRLSEIVATNDSWEEIAHQICKTLARHFGFRSSTFVVADGDRLIPLVGCEDVETGPISMNQIEGPLEQIQSVGTNALNLRKVTVIDDEIKELTSATFGDDGDVSYGGLVIPLTRGDQRVGVLVLRSPYDSNWLNITDLVDIDHLVAHLSILFSQILDFHERDLRIQASEALAMMLDAATSILSQEGLREFIPKSLATSLGSNGAIYIEVDSNKTITAVSCAGDEGEVVKAIQRVLVGSNVEDISIPGFSDSRNVPFFAEPNQSELYTPIVKYLTGSYPYVIVPIHTSQGLVGVAAGVLSNERSFWNLLERQLTYEWSINATLVTENYLLRHQEKLNLERFKEMAFRDSLTELPNREVFQDRLRLAAQKAERSGSQTAVIFIDIDHFKTINDTYGHRFGDEVLKEISNRLSRVFRESDTVARISGDEFTVLIEDSPEVNDLVEIARRAFERLNEPYVIDLKRINVSISMGMTSAVGHFNGDELLERADGSMYHSKKQGRSRLTYGDGYGPGTIIATSTVKESKEVAVEVEEDEVKLAEVEEAYTRGESDIVKEAFIDLTSNDQAHSSDDLYNDSDHAATVGTSNFTYKPFHRFSLDYIDIAKIRVALAELTNNFGGDGDRGQDQDYDSHDRIQKVYLHSDNDAKLEMVQPSRLTRRANEFESTLLEEIAEGQLLATEASHNFRGAKFLIPIDDFNTSDKDRIARALEKIASTNNLNRRIVLSVSTRRLATDEGLMIAIIAVAIRYRIEVMVTDVEDRSTRFYDLCSPVVTYFSIDASEAIGDSNRPLPTKMSSLMAIARERGVRVVATKVTDPSIVDSLLAIGISVVESSDMAVVDLAQQTYASQSNMN
ncbi:MAG: sensor domain-containing diguanylate cyclase [Actinomycetota bacterium]|nr:sensor domain-containing diguanylate cyclase [Actinomycetota bacterium]